MLNENSIQVIQSITNITNSAILDYPVTTIQNQNKNVIANIDFSKLEPTPWESFGIFDLSSFLGALTILEDPTIVLDNKIIVAQDNDSTIKFVTSSPTSLGDFTTDPEKVISTCAAESVVEVDIDVELFNRIRKGASVFKTLKDLFILKEGDKVSLKTGNKESFARQDNSYKINLSPTLDSGEDFDIAIPIDNFLSLPSMDFKLKIKGKNGKYRVVMENQIFQFVLSTIV